MHVRMVRLVPPWLRWVIGLALTAVLIAACGGGGVIHRHAAAKASEKAAVTQLETEPGGQVAIDKVDVCAHLAPGTVTLTRSQEAKLLVSFTGGSGASKLGTCLETKLRLSHAQGHAILTCGEKAAISSHSWHLSSVEPFLLTALPKCYLQVVPAAQRSGVSPGSTVSASPSASP